LPDPRDAYKIHGTQGLRDAQPLCTSSAPPAPQDPSLSGSSQQQALVQLVRQSQQRDPAAFTQLIRRYERMALSVAFSALGGAPGDGERAGDVVQEAFVRAWERLVDLKEPGSFGPWLCGIVRNLAIDTLRRSRLRPVADPENVDPLQRVAPDPHDELDLQEQRRLVAEALQELDETSRPVVVMRYYQDLSSKEIGEALGIAPAAVDMRLSRARQLLRRKLEGRVGQVFSEKA
jgi:RNA polymerase sigma-70 factor (ECF subfamily)